MSIHNGHDHSSNTFGSELNCLYYYYLNKDLTSDSSYLGFASPIQTVCYNPFIDLEDVSLVCSKFDTARYGSPNDSDKIPNVYRITYNFMIHKTLYEDKLSQSASKEPILNYYPYRYLMLYDGFNSPMIIKPQYLGSDGEIEIKVKTNVNQNSKYLLYVNGYKYDYSGNLEGIVNDTPLLVPVSSSAYSQFWATSSAQFNQSFINNSIENQTSYTQNLQSLELQKEQNITNNTIGITTSTLNAIGSAISLQFGSALSSVGNIAQHGANIYYGNKSYDLAKNHAEEIRANSQYYNEANRMATLKDYKKTPRAVSSLGNDVAFNKMKSFNRIILYDMILDVSVIRKLEKFYHKFGYPLNKYTDTYKIGEVRKNFNFVKMGYCDVFGEKIPKDDLEIIRSIFESGVTFWNVENKVRIGDYSVTNNERS